MRIATRLTIAALVPMLMAGMTITALQLNRSSIMRLQKRETAAIEISTDLRELNDIARSYATGHEERARLQFEAMHQHVTRLIGASQSSGVDASTMRSIATDVSFVGSLFDRIVANHQRAEGGTFPDASDAEERLTGQLLLRSRRANVAATRLVDALGQQMVDRQQITSATDAGVAFVVALIFALALIRLTRIITRSIDTLADGTEIVGAGDLDHRITLGVEDELSDLARSFNRMTARLQSATVSSDRLAEEIERRTKTARELDAERNQLEVILGNMSEAVSVWRADGTPIRVNGAALRMYGVRDQEELLRCLSDPEDVVVRDAEGRLVPRDEWPIARVMHGDSYAQVVLEVKVSSTGAHFVGSYSGTPVLDQSGLMVMGVVTVHDVSDIHAAQERERQELETTQTLLEVARAVGTWTEIDQLLQNVAALVLRSSDAQRVSIGLVGPENDEVRIAAVAGEKDEYEHASFPISGLPQEVADMLESGSTVLVDYDTVPPELRGIALAGSQLVLHVPIIYGNAPIGWIAVDDPNGRWHSVPRELDIIEAVASQTAVAIENARRYKAEHDIAERLQTALLELPAAVPGITYATLYQSASITARVGGDFYDLFEMDGNCVGITVGDVAGKGLNAAALTAVVKDTIRAHATDPGRSPERVLELTNELLFRSTPPESFVTVWFGMLDIRNGDLRYANAGHPAGLIVHSDGTIDAATASAPILGAVREITAEPGAECRLDPGSVLFLHTDGLTEARADREMFGDERLAALIQSMAGRNPEDMVNAAAQTVLEFTGGRLPDDVAILALRLAD